MGTSKKLISTLLFVIIVFTLVACRNADNDDKDGSFLNNTDNIDNTDIEKYIYIPHEISISNSDMFRYPVSGAIAHGEHIVYWYHDYMNLTIAKLMPDGESRVEVHFPVSDRLHEAKGLFITKDNHYALVVSTVDINDVATIHYIVYDGHGTEILSRELLDIPRYSDSFTQIEYVVITEDNIAVVTGNNNNQTLYILTTDGILLGEIDTNAIQGITRLRDNRVAAIFTAGSTSSLREIDFIIGSWGDTYQLSINSAEQVVPAETESPFDFFVISEGYLVGYVLELSKYTPLINWLESGIVVSPQHHIGMLSNNDIFVMQSEYVQTIGGSSVFTHLTMLKRNLRADADLQRTVITIGGLFLRQELLNEIAAFNLESSDYRIEIREYFSEDLGYEGSSLRMNVELITGRGPDIIVNNYFYGNIEFLADLYTFIDADPSINRTDFFPNVLKTMERADGTLPFVTNEFSISTMIALRGTAQLLTPLTFDSILQNLDESSPYSLAGELYTKSFFIHVILGDSNSFIDWDNGKANFDNEEFINLLEVAERLPDDSDRRYLDMADEYKRLRDGSQTLVRLSLYDINTFRIAQAVIGDIVAVGIPAPAGGQNIVNIKPWGDIGIYANSPNQEAAWSFVRRLLLPDAYFISPSSVIPLRIDLFDELIAESMTPKFWEFDDPRIGAVAGDEEPQIQFGIEIYAMTEEEALEIRSIIDSAVAGSRFNSIIAAIIDEEVQSFLNGIRSSADTARIIQNRVQRYFDEQE